MTTDRTTVERAWRRGRRWAALLALAAGVAPAAASGAPPAEAFARPPVISSVRVSPSGTHAALVLRTEGQPAVAAVVELARPSELKVVGGFPRADVEWVRWVNDERVYYFAAEPTGAVVQEGGAGVFAVDRDGGNMRQLIDWRWRNEETGTRIASRILTFRWHVYQSLDDGSADVMVVRRRADLENDPLPTELARLDTLTGSLRRLRHDMPANASDWLFDSAGRPQAVITERDGRTRLHVREPGGEAWTMVEDIPWLGDDGFRPLYVEGSGELVVAAARGRDTTALYTYDPRKRRFSDEPLVALDGFDVDSVETDDRARLVVGVHVRADRPMSVWFDERLAQVQQIVDKSLPEGRFNKVLCGRCTTASAFVVFSQSDRQPGEYYVYDHAGRSLKQLGPARPGLPEASQGRRSFHRVAARDGLPLPVIVTHPPGTDESTPLPAVVLVHGGPWVRGSDVGWESEAQFLASRGWRVLQVEFRGSTGFGWRHFHAGWKQWGLAMQDDLQDAVRWAATEKLVDPARVCIVGASYGGYAALMGPIRHPDTYRCAASFAGVTDIDFMYGSRWHDISRQSKRYALPTLIGDPKADADQLRQASPVRRVADIKVPVLLMQGTLDRRVPKENADAFEGAARAAGVTVERVDFPEEGHGFNEPENYAEYLRRLGAFLARHLGRPPG